MQQQQIPTAVNHKPRVRVILSDEEKEKVIDLFNEGVMIKDIGRKFGVGDVHVSSILSHHFAFQKPKCTCDYCEKDDIPQYRMKSPKMCFDCYFIRKKKCDELHSIRKEHNMDSLKGDSFTRKLLHVKICEEYIGNGLSINQITDKLVLSEGIILIALKKY